MTLANLIMLGLGVACLPGRRRAAAAPWRKRRRGLRPAHRRDDARRARAGAGDLRDRARRRAGQRRMRDARRLALAAATLALLGLRRDPASRPSSRRPRRASGSACGTASSSRVAFVVSLFMPEVALYAVAQQWRLVRFRLLRRHRLPRRRRAQEPCAAAALDERLSPVAASTPTPMSSRGRRCAPTIGCSGPASPSASSASACYLVDRRRRDRLDRAAARQHPRSASSMLLLGGRADQFAPRSRHARRAPNSRARNRRWLIITIAICAAVLGAATAHRILRSLNHAPSRSPQPV